MMRAGKGIKKKKKGKKIAKGLELQRKVQNSPTTLTRSLSFFCMPRMAQTSTVSEIKEMTKIHVA